jgi:hypothetical protein
MPGQPPVKWLLPLKQRERCSVKNQNHLQIAIQQLNNITGIIFYNCRSVYILFFDSSLSIPVQTILNKIKADPMQTLII